MPARQSTPGPSTGLVLHQQQTNTKKRSISDPDADSYSRGKKLKQDEENTAAKEKSKKNRARKRRRKQSITTMTPMKPRSKSRSAPASQQKPNSLLDAQSSVRLDSQATEHGLTEVRVVEDVVPEVPPADKGKAKAKESHEDSQSPKTSDSPAMSTSPQTEIARLTKELDSTTALLQRHQAHLSQMHQSLTCQICLDLLHKPFALAPCGHVVCHGCLVRWFTASTDEAHGGMHARSHIHKRKTCPICRSVISERPAEVWTIKGMVGGLVRSALVDLPVPPPEMTVDDAPTQAVDGNPDPWRNIFRPVRRHSRMPFMLPRLEEQAGGGGLESMGMYDAEDGGIYRCIECMNEIWDGVCTGCERLYPGHRVEDDGDDVDLGGDDADSVLGRRRDRRILRNLVGMFADGQRELDADEFDSWDEESVDEDEDHADNISWEERERYRQMGMAHAFDGLPSMFGPGPMVGGMHGMQLFADFTEDEEEGGIAMIEEESNDGGEVGYESSFIDDDSISVAGPRIREVIELSDSEDNDDVPMRPRRARQRRRVEDSDPWVDEDEEDDDDVEIARMRDDSDWSSTGFGSPRVRVAWRRRPPVVIESDE